VTPFADRPEAAVLSQVRPKSPDRSRPVDRLA
jgi:hypothetical protein